MVTERMIIAGYEVEIYQSTVDKNQLLLTFEDVDGGEGEGCTLRLSRDDASKLSDALSRFVVEDA